MKHYKCCERDIVEISVIVPSSCSLTNFNVHLYSVNYIAFTIKKFFLIMSIVDRTFTEL